MVKFHMIDTASMGIRRVFRIQREKYFPMPDYDLSTPNEVKVTVYGKVLNETFMHILFDRPDLDLQTVFLLDQVAKGVHLQKDAITYLRKKKLVEGRATSLFLSADVAKAAEQEAQYIRNKGFNDQYYRDMIVNYLKQYGRATKMQFRELLLDKLPDSLNETQKERKVGNLLTSLRKQGMITIVDHEGRQPIWALTDRA